MIYFIPRHLLRNTRKISILNVKIHRRLEAESDTRLQLLQRTSNAVHGAQCGRETQSVPMNLRIS